MSHIDLATLAVFTVFFGFAWLALADTFRQSKYQLRQARYYFGCLLGIVLCGSIANFFHVDQTITYAILAILGTAALWWQIGPLTLAATAIKKRDYKRVLDLLEPVIKRDPEHVAALVSIAPGYIGLGQFEKAIECCDKAIELMPSEGMAYNNRAAALLGLNRADDAIDAANKALGLNQKFSLARTNRAIGYAMTRRYEECLADCQQALKENPQLVLALYWQSVAKCAMWKLDDALLDCSRALNLCSWQNPALAALVRVVRAACYLNKHEFAKVLSECNDILNCPDAPPIALLMRAEAHAAQGNIDQALLDMDNLETKEIPKVIQAFSLSARADIALKQNSPVLALEYSRRAVELDNDPSILTYRAKMLLATNDVGTAFDLLSQAIEMHKFAAEAYWYRHKAYVARGQRENASKDEAFARSLGYQPLD